MCKTSVYPPFYSINIVIVNFSICSIQYIAFIETVDEYFTVQYFAPFKGRTVFNQFWTRVFRCSIAKIFCVWSCHGFEIKRYRPVINLGPRLFPLQNAWRKQGKSQFLRGNSLGTTLIIHLKMLSTNSRLLLVLWTVFSKILNFFT